MVHIDARTLMKSRASIYIHLYTLCFSVLLSCGVSNYHKYETIKMHRENSMVIALVALMFFGYSCDGISSMTFERCFRKCYRRCDGRLYNTIACLSFCASQCTTVFKECWRDCTPSECGNLPKCPEDCQVKCDPFGIGNKVHSRQRYPWILFFFPNM